MGVHCTIHRNQDQVIVFTDDGSNCTDRVPSVVKEILNLAEKELVLDVEMEMWKDGKNFDREQVSGYLQRKDPADDINVVCSVFGVLWYPGVGDIHTKSELERLSFLDKLNIGQSTIGIPDIKIKLNKAPYDICRSPEKFRASLHKFASAPGTEGAMIKLADKDYSLSGGSDAIIKYKNAAEIMAIVWRVNRTTIPTQYTYNIALDYSSQDGLRPETIVEVKGRKYTTAGSTYNTDNQCQVGDVIKVRFHTINIHKDTSTGFLELRLFEPVFSQRMAGEKRPDSFSSAVRIGEEASLIQRKSEKGYIPFEEDDLTKANYPGGKLRFADKILKYAPDGQGKLMFDPMSGCGGVLIAAVEKGYKVWANELSVTPALYLKGIFNGRPVEVKELETFLDGSGVEGFMTHNMPIFGYPTNKNHRKYIDGLVVKAHQMSGEAKWSFLAILSNLFMMWRGTFDSKWHAHSGSHGIGTNDRTRSQAKYALNRFNEICEKTRGHGKVTAQDAFSMDIPQADVIYYDPPYFDGNGQPIGRYNALNWRSDCLLAQKLIPKRLELKFDATVELCQKLAVRTPLLLISQPQRARKFKVDLAPVSSKVNIVGFQLPSHGGGIQNESKIKDTKRGERLYIITTKVAKNSIQKAADLFMDYPPEGSKQRFVIHRHHISKGAHSDFRIESGGKNLVGYTMADLMEGTIKEPVLTIDAAKELQKEQDNYFKIDWNDFSWKQRMRGSKEVNVEIVSQRKGKIPSGWLSFQGIVEAGKPGASKEFPGVFLIVARGIGEWGAMKSYVNEFFLKASTGTKWYSRIIFREIKNIWREQGEQEKSLDIVDETDYDIDRVNDLFDEYPDFDALKGALSGGLIKRVIPASEGGFGDVEAGWVAIKPNDMTPYVLSDRAVKAEWLPPIGFSALPGFIRTKIPKQFRYWELQDRSKVLEIRNKLVGEINNRKIPVPF